MLVRVTVTNRGPGGGAARCSCRSSGSATRGAGATRRGRGPELFALEPFGDVHVVETAQEHLGRFWLYVEGAQELLFTENESNATRLWGVAEPRAVREGRVPRGHRPPAAATP